MAQQFSTLFKFKTRMVITLLQQFFTNPAYVQPLNF